MRPRGPRLGEFLERDGVLTREQLLRALRNQKVVGGKLGTCLLEIEALPEEALVRGLAEQQGAPASTPEELRGIPDEILAMVPAKVARAHFLVPFRATGTQIEVAMVDARDLRALDELAFVTGRRVRPYVASEVRVMEALEKYYDVECPPRFVKLLDRLNRSRFLWRTHEEAPARRDQLQWDPSLGVRVAAGEMAPLADDELPLLVAPPPRPEVTQPIPTTEAQPPARRSSRRSTATQPIPTRRASTAEAIEKTRPGGPTAAGASDAPTTVEDIEHRLLDPSDADAVAETVIEFARTRTATCALFQVRRLEAAGWMGHGVDPARLSLTKIRLDRPSIFLALREGAPFHRGPLADLAEHQSLRALLGEAAAQETLAVPLRMRDRLVGVLAATPRAVGEGGAELADLQRLAALAAHALELCILRRKLRKS